MILHPEKLAETLAAVYHASFAELRDINTPEGFMPIFTGIFGEKVAKEMMIKVSS